MRMRAFAANSISIAGAAGHPASSPAGARRQALVNNRSFLLSAPTPPPFGASYDLNPRHRTVPNTSANTITCTSAYQPNSPQLGKAAITGGVRSTSAFRRIKRFGSQASERKDALCRPVPSSPSEDVQIASMRIALQYFLDLRYLHDCSDCFRWSESPGGPCTHWKAPPFHGARRFRPFVGLQWSRRSRPFPELLTRA